MVLLDAMDLGAGGPPAGRRTLTTPSQPLSADSSSPCVDDEFKNSKFKVHVRTIGKTDNFPVSPKSYWDVTQRTREGRSQH